MEKTRVIEINNRMRETIPEEVMLARLAQSEQMREFFIEMWKQNPALAKQGGESVRRLLSPLETLPPKMNAPHSIKQRGVSLVELIMFIVIVSVALAGILLVFNVTTKGSADPLVHKQALAAAESLLEEIQLQDFSPPSGEAHANVTQENRASGYHIIMDYNGFNMPAPPGIFSMNDSSSTSAVLASYSASVAVSDVALGTAPNQIQAGSAVLITVTVTVPQGTQIEISGYRTDYCCSKVE